MVLAATGAELAGAGAIIGHFWHNIPNDDLRRMSELLEAGEAGLVVVAVDHTGEDIGALLSNATSKIVVDTTRADFERAFSQAIERGRARSVSVTPAQSSGVSPRRHDATTPALIHQFEAEHAAVRSLLRGRRRAEGRVMADVIGNRAGR